MDTKKKFWFVASVMASLAWLLITGCASPDKDLVAEHNRLIARRGQLDAAQQATYQRLRTLTQNNAAIQKEIRDTEMAAQEMLQRSERFWLSHREVLSRMHDQQKTASRLCFGISAPITGKTTARVSENVSFIPEDGNAKEYPVVKSVQMTEFAEMQTLPLSRDAKFSVLMDANLATIPEDCRLDGFVIMLDNVSDAGTVGLVVLDDQNQIVELRTYDLDDNQLELVQSTVNGHNLVQVFFDKSFGSVPVKKGQRWGILVSKAAIIPCEYIGLSTENNIPLIGGNILAATLDSEDATDAKGTTLTFNALAPTLPSQDYNPAGTKRFDDVETGKRDADIRSTLKPAITLAVYGSAETSKQEDANED